MENLEENFHFNSNLIGRRDICVWRRALVESGRMTTIPEPPGGTRIHLSNNHLGFKHHYN